MESKGSLLTLAHRSLPVVFHVLLRQAVFVAFHSIIENEKQKIDQVSWFRILLSPKILVKFRKDTNLVSCSR